MKKFLVLALIACVASVNAAIWFEVDSLVVNEGETFQVRVVSDIATENITIGGVTLTDAADWANGALGAGFTGGIPNHGILRDGSISNIAYSQMYGTINVGDAWVTAGSTLWSFDVTAGAAGTEINIGGYAGANPFGGPPLTIRQNGANTTLGTLSVDVVPEPMTMALLGLGGLFIRRRRA